MEHFIAGVVRCLRFFIFPAAGELGVGCRSSYSLNQRLAIHTRLIHHPRDRVGIEGDARASFEDVEDLPRTRDLRIKPGVLQVPLKNHGHAVME
jgi:hypothetical protein